MGLTGSQLEWGAGGVSDLGAEKFRTFVQLLAQCFECAAIQFELEVHVEAAFMTFVGNADKAATANFLFVGHLPAGFADEAVELGDVLVHTVGLPGSVDDE